MDLSGSNITINNKRIKDFNIAAADTYIQTRLDTGFNINIRPNNSFDGNVIIARKTVDEADNAKFSLIRRITAAELADNEAIYDFAAGTISLAVGIDAVGYTTGDIDVDIYSETYQPEEP